MNPPNTLFVFVSETDLLTRHNFEVVGEMSSAAVSASEEDPRIRSLFLAGELEYGVQPTNPRALYRMSPFMTTHYADPLEGEIESVRLAESRMLPSRLSALFGFANRENCERAAEMHGWSLAEVREVRVYQDDSLVRAHRANMNLITTLRLLHGTGALSPDQWQAALRDYWAGSGRLPVVPVDARYQTPLWEWLVEGKLFRTDAPRATLTDLVEMYEKTWGFVPTAVREAAEREMNARKNQDPPLRRA